MIHRRQLIRCAGAALAAVLASGSSRAAPIRRMVLIHGRGQQGRNADQLKAEWMETLKRGATAIGRSVPSDLTVTLPFYGDVLDGFTREFQIPLASDITSRGSPQQDDFLEFQADFADAVRIRAGITDAHVDAEYGDNPRPRGPQNWEWVQAILRAIDRNSPGMGQRTLEVFTRDVFLYVTRTTVRDAIDSMIAAALTTEPTLVVSHSLGTVVAYNVLRSDRRALQVPLLVTLGSPLAVRAVRDRLRPLNYPGGVAGWYNAFDTRDVVSLYPLDVSNFPVQGVIENNSTVRNSTENRHGIVGYLDNADVARMVLGAAG